MDVIDSSFAEREQQSCARALDYLKSARESSLLTVAYGDDVEVFPATITAQVQPLPPTPSFDDQLAANLMAHSLMAKALLEQLIGEDWVRAYELATLIMVERLKAGMKRHGKTARLRGEDSIPSWTREVLPRLDEHARSAVLAAVEMQSCLGEIISERQSTSPNLPRLACFAFRMGRLGASIEALQRSYLVEGGVKAKQRPQKAAATKAQKKKRKRDRIENRLRELKGEGVAISKAVIRCKSEKLGGVTEIWEVVKERQA